MRLDKFLRDQGLASRAELRESVRRGHVSVNGNIIKDPGAHVDPHQDMIHLNGKPIKYREFVYYMMNKPKGVVTATEDRKMKTVLDLLDESIRRREVFPVGRLDRDTEGLLLITNNGTLAHELLSPKKHVAKLYEALLDCYPGDGAIRMFEEGVVLDDGYKSLPAALKFLSKTDPVIAHVEIFEGKFHQVKRMFKAVGANVTGLKRLKMGAVSLDENLKPGEYRELTYEEIQSIGG